MVKIDFDDNFRRIVSKIKDASLRDRVEKLLFKIRDTENLGNYTAFSPKFSDKTIRKKGKQIKRIVYNPEIGKPMKHNRKGTRELYLPSFRLSYAYDKNNDVVVILDLYHKDEQ